MNNRTFELLKEKINESGLDSFLIGKKANIQYLTGFTGDNSFAVIGPEQASFFTSSLYSEHAQSTVREPFTVKETTVNIGIFKSFADFGRELWGKRLGYEADSLTCLELSKLKASLKNVELVSTTDIVEELRTEKNLSEIKSISAAQRISETVFEEISSFIIEGVEEREIACEIDYRLRKRGGERAAFETIVAFGPNASKPHAVPTKRKLKTGDMIIIDMGTVVDGYASDMTRTVVLGKADKNLKKVYALVLEAQEAAIEGIAAGIKCSDVDQMARNVFQKAGYGDRFIHSLGHGVGLDVHEIPRLSTSSKSILKKNMVITVEPGLYIPKWGGVRIEDMVVVTGDGCQNITKAPKYLLEL